MYRERERGREAERERERDKKKVDFIRIFTMMPLLA